MDPDKMECKGFYMYGSGFYAERDHRDAIMMMTAEVKAFCGKCPILQECWAELRVRVDREHPDEVAEFMRRVFEGAKKGIPGGRIAAKMMEEGRPDPYMADTLENFRKGMKDAVTQ